MNPVQNRMVYSLPTGRGKFRSECSLPLALNAPPDHEPACPVFPHAHPLRRDLRPHGRIDALPATSQDQSALWIPDAGIHGLPGTMGLRATGLCRALSVLGVGNGGVGADGCGSRRDARRGRHPAIPDHPDRELRPPAQRHGRRPQKALRFAVAPRKHASMSCLPGRRHDMEGLRSRISASAAARC